MAQAGEQNSAPAARPPLTPTPGSAEAAVLSAVDAATKACAAEIPSEGGGAGAASLPPLQHALLGWATLWQFPASAAVGVATALQVNKEIAAVSALLQCGGDGAGEGGGVDEALLRNLLRQVQETDGFQQPVKQFLAALQVRIQASFDMALENLNAQALALKAAAPSHPIPVSSPAASSQESVQDLSESFRLKVEIEKRKRSIKSLEADKRVHEALNRKLEAEVALVESRIREVEAQAESVLKAEKITPARISF